MNRPHLLVIEDDPSVCELLFSCLTSSGHRVTLTQSGEAALPLIEEDPPELVVLDLNLPGMNGLDICRAMRRDPWMGKIPVLMLTGQTEEDDVVVGFEVGADDYMTKPFSPKLLNVRVKALLRRGVTPVEARSSAAGPMEIKGPPEKLQIKTLGKCELRHGDRYFSWAEEFSPAQRQLMSMLVGSPAGKVSQEEVQTEFWPDSPASRARSSFDSLLSRVRRTLDQILEPFDSKRYLVVKRGYLCLENAQIDAHEFRRLIRKGTQQVAAGDLWPAEVSFSAAFSLWRGTFIPGDFGSDAAIIFQDELEQLYLESSMIFARLLAEKGRHGQAVNLLRDALRYEPANDSIVRLLYQLCLAQDNPGQARQILKNYSEALLREGFTNEEIQDTLHDFPKDKAGEGWLLSV